MVSGRLAPANALWSEARPRRPRRSRRAPPTPAADSASGSVERRVLNRGGSREGGGDTLRYARARARPRGGALRDGPSRGAPGRRRGGRRRGRRARPRRRTRRWRRRARRLAERSTRRPARRRRRSPRRRRPPPARAAAREGSARGRRNRRGVLRGDDEPRATSRTRALCVTARTSALPLGRRRGASVRRPAREHLLQAHLRLACAALAPAPPSPSRVGEARENRRQARRRRDVPADAGRRAEGVRRSSKREPAPRHAAEKRFANSKLIAAVRAELGVGAGADADAAGATPHAQRGAAAAVFSARRAGAARARVRNPYIRNRGRARGRDCARTNRAGASSPDSGAEHVHVSHGDVAASARGAARLGPPAAAAAPGAKGWHPGSAAAPRARGGGDHARPEARRAERARGGPRVARHTKIPTRARGGGGGAHRARWRHRPEPIARGVGKRVGGETRLASAGQPGSMPAAATRARVRLGERRRLGDASVPTPMSRSGWIGIPNEARARDESGSRPETRPPGGGPGGGARGAVSRAAPANQIRRRNAFPLPGGPETPAVARTRARRRRRGARRSRASGSTWLPHGDGLETPAVARTRVAATPVASRGDALETGSPSPSDGRASRGRRRRWRRRRLAPRDASRETPAATARAKQETRNKKTSDR